MEARRFYRLLQKPVNKMMFSIFALSEQRRTVFPHILCIRSAVRGTENPYPLLHVSVSERIDRRRGPLVVIA